MTVTCSSNEKPWPWLEKPTTEVFFYFSEHVLMCYGIVQEEKQKHCVIYEISTTLSIYQISMVFSICLHFLLADDVLEWLEGAYQQVPCSLINTDV